MARGDLNDSHLLALQAAFDDSEFGLHGTPRFKKPSGKIFICSNSTVRSLKKRGLLTERKDGSLGVTPAGAAALNAAAGRVAFLFASD